MKQHRKISASAAIVLLLLLPARAQTPPPDTAALTARSAALSPADKAQAQKLFATAFTLWQSGDFAAAEIGFKQGLDIDPANAMANYYYGDCLMRRKDKAEAKDYLGRAAALGNGTAEGMKAQAQLQALAAAPATVADMTDDEISTALIAHWSTTYSCPWGTGTYQLNIPKITNGALTGVNDVSWTNGFKSGHIQGTRLTLVYSNYTVSAVLVSPSRMEGSAAESEGSCKWTADKQ